MVHRQFQLQCGSDRFTIDYDTTDGFDVLQAQILSLTSVFPERQKIVVEEGGLVLAEVDDLEVILNILVFLLLKESEGSSGTLPDQQMSMSEGERIAQILQVQAEEDMVSMQSLQIDAGEKKFEQILRPAMSQVLMYENGIRQAAARNTVPVGEINQKALARLAKDGTFNPSNDQKDHAFLLQLLFWFKQSFSWVDAPSCDGCGGKTIFTGIGAPSSSESDYGCPHVELYRCNICSTSTRFPRYNDPQKLLETRRGRYEEWANCFTLYCRAFGYESRLILDFNDCVWTECFSNLLGRWVHLDPWEGVYDKPLLYEEGLNKNLRYVIAISKDGTFDVTRKYTRKWHEVLSRRNITTEPSAKHVLSKLTSEQRLNRYSWEILHVPENRGKEKEITLENIDHQSESSLTLHGRQGGSQERGTSILGVVGAGDENTMSYTTCPSRPCVDDHVSKIYDSLSNLLCHFVSNGLPKTEVVTILKILKQLLMDLKSSSFKVRKSSIDLHSISSQPLQDSLPVIDEFLCAVSLRREVDVDENIHISLAVDPERTSIALPVALDCLNEITVSVDKINQFDQNFLINFSRLNRISSGSVLASGEEIPFGIATSAFDGGHTSKWVEPNGAKGCWLSYFVKASEAHTLKAYELMSANDDPDGDPMDWVLEGSEDGGSNWNVIDQQTSQIFDERLLKKRFEVECTLKLKAFRFKFLAVRNPEATSRFQIGSIDLYAAKS